jgi:putative transposase
MDDCNIIETLGQVSSSEAGDIFRNFLRGGVRQMICEVMAEEVTELCGPKHRPNNGIYVRAGSSEGRVLVDGEREEIVRPRVRREDPSEGSQEVKLATYQAANDPEQLNASIIQALSSGVSTREMQNMKPSSPGVGKSNVSRLWQDVGHKFVDEFRGRDLSKQSWVALMLDGIRLSKDQLAIVASWHHGRGIQNNTWTLNLGSSESAEVCKDLMRRLKKRGFPLRASLCSPYLTAATCVAQCCERASFPDSVDPTLPRSQRTKHQVPSCPRNTGANLLDCSNGFEKFKARTGC